MKLKIISIVSILFFSVLYAESGILERSKFCKTLKAHANDCPKTNRSPRDRGLPKTPADLLSALLNGNVISDKTVYDYVKAEDLPVLIDLLDSTIRCGYFISSYSSYRPPGESTIGDEAAFLIEGYWKRYYPPNLTSSGDLPNKAEIKYWYRNWLSLRKKTEQSDADGKLLRGFAAP